MEEIKPFAWIVLTASFFSLFFNSSLNYSVGVIHIALLDTYVDEDIQTISWLGSLFSSMFAISGFMGTILINMFNVRVCVMVSGVVTLIGFSLSSIVTDMRYLFITYSLIGGTGQAICYTGSMVTLGYYFKHKASMASGIALCGCGLCTFVFPPISQLFVDRYGLNGAFLLLGALGFQSTVCGALMRPTEFEIVAKRRLLCIMLKSMQFCLFLISSVAFNMGQSIIYLFLPDYFRHLGSSSMEAAFILSIAGVTGVVARVLLGFLTQLVNSAIVYGGTFGIMGIITYFVKYMTTLPSKLFFTSMFGFYTGACWVLHYTILVETVGIGKLSDAMGIGMVFCGIGYFTGPPLAVFMMRLVILRFTIHLALTF
ncbi:hypothetical protein LOTGIDRAFT_134531 [Lottia gigantea]|uniref:Major facilitator superfamily (MFS) profile domain-containing protein n=1 Tax=Lottia gigantea TaxID=225164 RepID=V3YWS8_LOTGI|nr:hypothetical protein LOTGIDRAFT_134531 [Lottia gigantea]ESO82493.1 hypothetical protein LOTGIDRAFT_134531 [Lottia gigantea]